MFFDKLLSVATSPGVEHQVPRNLKISLTIFSFQSILGQILFEHFDAVVKNVRMKAGTKILFVFSAAGYATVEGKKVIQKIFLIICSFSCNIKLSVIIYILCHCLVDIAV